jgi:small subunit ribosomal protein S5
MARRDYVRQPKEFEERIIQIKRVSKKTKGGNKIGFTALVVLGDRKGRVGTALGKATNVAAAIQKGISKAKENIVMLDIQGDTIPHDIIKKYKSSKILLKPAPKGSGIIAGGTVREVVELAGIKDISTKMLGSKNKQVNVMCTIKALQSLRKAKEKK